MKKSSNGGVISAIRPGSPAETAGIEPGSRLLSAGGQAVRDVVDLQYLQAESEVEVVLECPDGSEDRILFEKEIDEDLGFEFDNATWDGITLCNNNCFFCFLKGLPPRMRKTLYAKDDDYRLSFLHGNFVTLTNLTDADWERIDQQKLSPLNVSVHATDLALRRKMLTNAEAPDVLEQLRRLGSMGISAHTQVVLCPGVNDGTALDKTLADLTSLHPVVRTVSIVPVGASPKLETRAITSDGIELQRPNREYAHALIRRVLPLQRECRKLRGATVVHCGDEYYLTAGVSVPGSGAYDGFPQYENGVGMVRRLLDDWNRSRRRLSSAAELGSGRRLVIGTGTLAAPLLAAMADEVSQLTGASIEVQAVENTVFGDRVNVSGLLGAQDFIKELRNCGTPDLFILPRTSLDYFGTRFLDDASIDEVEAALGAPVGFATNWSEVVRAMADELWRPGIGHSPNGVFWSEISASSPVPVD